MHPKQLMQHGRAAKGLQLSVSTAQDVEQTTSTQKHTRMPSLRQNTGTSLYRHSIPTPLSQLQAQTPEHTLKI